MNQKTRRLLITGAGGFVGGHVAVLARSEWRVFGSWLHRPFDIPGVEKIRLDLTDHRDLRDRIREISPESIIHCAAMSNIDTAQSDRITARRINTEATRVIAGESARIGARLIFTSTDMVFDGRRGDYSESDPVAPLNLYGESKAAAEEAVRESVSDHVVARLALVYGRPVTGGNSFSEFIRKRIARDQEIPLFTDQFRTPIWVGALARLLLELASHPFVGTLHLGGPERIDRYAFALKLAVCHGLPTGNFRPISMFDAQPEARRPQDVSLDSRKAAGLLRTPVPGISEGVRLA
ncbi:MAG TPA: SDR family oxidoreductase [bacterium]|nr:SDR family oxidoreductase [bacterium]